MEQTFYVGIYGIDFGKEFDFIEGIELHRVQPSSDTQTAIIIQPLLSIEVALRLYGHKFNWELAITSGDYDTYEERKQSAHSILLTIVTLMRIRLHCVFISPLISDTSWQRIYNNKYDDKLPNIDLIKTEFCTFIPTIPIPTLGQQHLSWIKEHATNYTGILRDNPEQSFRLTTIWLALNTYHHEQQLFMQALKLWLGFDAFYYSDQSRCELIHSVYRYCQRYLRDLPTTKNDLNIMCNTRNKIVHTKKEVSDAAINQLIVNTRRYLSIGLQVAIENQQLPMKKDFDQLVYS